MGVFSFNANKIITSGGGGMIVTEDREIFEHLLHISKTSKVRHRFEFFHDSIGYNYRMPNLNACLGVAQLELLPRFLKIKRELFVFWSNFFLDYGLKTKGPIGDAISNHWLIPVEFENSDDRNTFLEVTNNREIGTRPIWTLMSKLPMFSGCFNDGLINSKFAEERFVCVPSGIPVGKLSDLKF
jgi:dTDP-4-amino-4,6-dideoxygalactose transaminase